MIAIKIKQPKVFMSKLLTSDTFDRFLLEEAQIETFNTFTINGRIHKDFYKGSSDVENPDDLGEFSEWERLRPICLDLIKGKQTPLKLKFVLRLADKDKEGISPLEFSPCINISYSSGEIIVITGISYSTFTLDKDAEKAWDKYIPSFLESNGIDIELI